MKILLCHPGTQHAGKLAAILQKEELLGRFFTGFRPKSDSMLARWFRLSGHRALDESLIGCTTQIRAPELFAKASQFLGWSGERVARLRNAWFQKLIPDQAIAASDAVIGFDTASWILARRACDLAKPFVLDRAAVHRSTRASIRGSFEFAGLAGQAASSVPTSAQDHLEAEEIALASKIVVASRFSERSLLDAGVAPEKIAVIPYGVNSNWFADAGARGGAGDKVAFLFVGHVTMDKGVGILLDAWKRMGTTDAELWLAGGGDPAVVQRAKSIPGVRVLGKLGPEELRKAYQGASVFVFPTFCDGFGMVLLEAMSSGLPIIATPHCAAPELVEDGAAGVICPVGDAEAFAAAMADACANRSVWVKRGVAAQEIAKSYSWEAYGKRWASLLREVVA